MENIRKVVLLVMILGILPVAYGEGMGNTGAVYTMSNSMTGNDIMSFDRMADGTLSLSGTFPTQGLGTGGGLGNQGGLMLSEEDKMLLVVNAGSDEISVFKVKSDGLEFTDKVSSGGIRPVSIAIHKDLVYVLNSGGTGNIAGFHLSDDGKLNPISGSTQPLSGPATGPAEISFSPDGDVLVVTEKTTSMIDTYTVDHEGIANGPLTRASNGLVPFGFAFDIRGHLIVSEAPSSSLSSYAVDKDGNLENISISVPDSQTAACWVVITKDGKFAYTANAGSNTISSYDISPKGILILLNGVAATTGAGPIEMALSKNSKFLYNLNSGGQTITGFQIQTNGILTPVTTVSGIPSSANGLAAT